MQKWQKIINQRGQMAIFIALSFQVLFVLFAMIVNIGLIVFQKINLQNATDLAAYYAAQKQAEVLNAIAHENYQIHQAWKLFVWRYRVLGAEGEEHHPGRTMLPQLQDVRWNPLTGEILYPVICVSHGEWEGVTVSESECQNFNNIPIFKPHKVTIDLTGLGTFTAALFRASIAVVLKTCNEAGPRNWEYAALIWYIYRRDAAEHKKTIKWLAETLAAGKDLAGNSISDGVKKTLFNNLSAPNAEQPPDVQMYNSLDQTPWTAWLHDNAVDIHLPYLDLSGDSDSGCRKDIRDVAENPDDMVARSPLSERPTADLLRKYMKEPQPGADPEMMQTSWGFEKNPWLMVYMGIQATVQTRSIFSPFGKPTAAVARAFAQPFGGRIGPWYQTMWAQGAQSSSGPPVDLVSPIRMEDRIQGDIIVKQVPPNVAVRLFPNYSRFPGDQIGLMSVISLASLPPRDQRVPSRKFNLRHYADAAAVDPATNDTLVWNGEVPQQPPILRPYELAAVSPDLFDAAYYSIEPTFKLNYFDVLSRRQDKPSPMTLRLDLGARANADAPLLNLQVREQISLTNTVQNLANLFYRIRDKNHLLTGWVTDQLYVFDQFPVKTFGHCQFDAIPEAPTPGGCAVGGRVGYSVRLVSKNYLTSEKHNLGGQGVGPGPILNPPPDNF